MNLHIDAISSFVPKTCLDVRQDHERLGLSAAAARVISQIYELPVCPCFEGSDEELLLRAASQLLARAETQDKRIVGIIHVHTGAVIGTHGMSVPTILVRKLGLSPALILGMCQLNCVSVISALDLAQTLLASEDDDNARILILVGENAHNAELRVIPNVAIVGDVACAALVGRSNSSGRNRLLGKAIHVHKGFSEGIWLSTTSETSRDYEAHFQTWLKAVMDEALDKAGITMDQLQAVLPHNVNVWMWRKAAAFMGLPIDKVFLENTRNTAHCLGADMLLNLESATAGRRLTQGDYYIMATAGVGGVFGAAVFQY